jgi:hypothetical protein
MTSSRSQGESSDATLFRDNYNVRKREFQSRMVNNYSRIRPSYTLVIATPAKQSEATQSHPLQAEILLSVWITSSGLCPSSQRRYDYSQHLARLIEGQARCARAWQPRGVTMTEITQEVGLKPSIRKEFLIHTLVGKP